MVHNWKPLLNIDAGEYDNEDPELYRIAHIVNIACGGHAGDETSMARVNAACVHASTRVGAHPSYDDRGGFGRRALAIEPRILQQQIERQIAELFVQAKHAAARIEFVKPHGALYHRAAADRQTADALLAGATAILGINFTVIGPPQGELRKAAERKQLAYAREGFADRQTTAEGALVPRTDANALITDPEQVRRVAEKLARSATVETICVHADTPGSVAIARIVRSVLDNES